MKLKLLKQIEAPLLSRKRVVFEADFEKQKTPSNEEVKKSVASNLKVGEDVIKIRHIYQKFGVNKAKVITHIYDSAEKLKDIEEVKKSVKKKKKKTQEKK